MGSSSAATNPRQSAANFRAAANEMLHQFAKATGVYLWLDYIGYEPRRPFAWRRDRDRLAKR